MQVPLSEPRKYIGLCATDLKKNNVPCIILIQYCYMCVIYPKMKYLSVYNLFKELYTDK